MVGILIRMRLATLRHSLGDGRGTWLAIGGALGLALAAGTAALGAGRFAQPGATGDLLALALLGWALGWLIAAVVTGGGGEALRPEFFALLPIAPRTLAASLLGAAFVGVAPLVSLLAFTGLIARAAGLGAGPLLVALPATALQLALVILLARVAIGVLGVVIQSRPSAVLAALVNGTIYALAAQGWVVIVAFAVEADQLLSVGFPPVLATLLRALPSGWGLVAVEAAARGDWPLALGALLGQVALLGLLLRAWARLLVRRMTTTPSGQAVHLRTAARADPLDSLPLSRTGAVVAKELRGWSRDLMRIHGLGLAFFYCLVFCGLPLLIGWAGLLPWAGVLLVAMAAAGAANLYGYDGTALWLTLLTPDASADDVRGRQWAWLLTVAPPATALTLALTWASGQGWAWPWVLAALPAVLGGGAGLILLVSVTGLIPGTDPHRRGGNPLSFGENESALLGTSYLMLALVALTAVPATGVVLLGALRGSVALQWAGLPVGLGSGALLAWWLGRAAARQLAARGPELLHQMRTGTLPQARVAAPDAAPLPRGKAVIVQVCWSICWLPLFPQGLVPAIFKLNGVQERVWFLALYLPAPYQWPVIVAMIAVGLILFSIPLAIRRQHARHQGATAARDAAAPAQEGRLP